MDRRRFVPSSEGLEGRTLQSGSTTSAPGLFGQTSAALTAKALAQEEAPSFRLKVLRIEHLPYYLNQLQPGRFLPTDTLKQLQVDLSEIAARLQPPPPAFLDAFNLQIRDTLPRQNLTPTDAQALNRLFGKVLEKAGAETQTVASLQNDLNELARADSQSPNPVYLATNDYSTILETALAVGHPIALPTPPILAAKDGLQLTNGGVTGNHEPRLVGTYSPGATIDAGTKMEIVDGAGHVYGTGTVDSTGKWAVVLNPAVSDGKYILHSRAKDALGHVSNPSEAFVLKVVTKTR